MSNKACLENCPRKSMIGKQEVDEDSNMVILDLEDIEIYIS